MRDEPEPPPSPDSATIGSVGAQAPASPADARAIVKAFLPATQGLTPITTAEQLAELARSGLPPEVKSEILGAILHGAQQTVVADLRYRLEMAEKETVKLRRQLAEKSREAGDLRGDIRVRDERIEHLKSHRNRDSFLMFISSVLFGVGGAFIGRSAAATIIGFAAGLALAVFVWRDRPLGAEKAR